MIRRPKRLEEGEGFYDLKAQRAVLNFEGGPDYSYLLSLCGIEGCASAPAEGETLTLRVGKGGGVVPDDPSEEAFAIEIADGITVAANTHKGISQGLKFLAALVRETGGRLPRLKLWDSPDVSFRGTHICIFPENDGTEKEDTRVEAVKNTLLAAALSGYNFVFMEFWGTFPYRRHPYAQWSGCEYTREVVEKLISYCIDDLHITPLPCQNLTSHAGWSRIASRRHVVLDQRPDLYDMWIPGGWCFATENPDTKAFLRDVIDDLWETYRHPPIIHVSTDKCFGFGSSEQDRTKPADALFATHVCNLNSYIQSKGSRMMMWADMLYSSMDALYWKAGPSVVESLPRNILINVWTHNDVGEYWADIDFFEKRGFETVYSPFINAKGARSMVKLCKNKGSLGILQTTWHRPQSTLPTVLATGGMLWGESEPDLENAKAQLEIWKLR